MARPGLRQVEFTSDELHAAANTVPSTSLEEDLMETQERIHHRQVAQLQAAIYAKVEAICQEGTKVFEQCKAKDPKLTEKELKRATDEWTADRYDELMQKFGQELDGLIGLLEYRRQQLFEWLQAAEIAA